MLSRRSSFIISIACGAPQRGKHTEAGLLGGPDQATFLSGLGGAAVGWNQPLIREYPRGLPLLPLPSSRSREEGEGGAAGWGRGREMPLQIPELLSSPGQFLSEARPRLCWGRTRHPTFQKPLEVGAMDILSSLACPSTGSWKRLPTPFSGGLPQPPALLGKNQPNQVSGVPARAGVLRQRLLGLLRGSWPLIPLASLS